MNYGEHLSTLIAVIVGLAVTELLAGASRTLRSKDKPGFFWPDWRGTLGPNAMCMAAAALLLVAARTSRDRVRWTATVLVEAVVLAFILIYLKGAGTPG